MEEKQQDQISGKEEYEARKAEKLKQKEVENKTQKRKRGGFMRYLVIIIILALLVFGFYSLVKKELSGNEDFDSEISILGEEHTEVDPSH